MPGLTMGRSVFVELTIRAPGKPEAIAVHRSIKVKNAESIVMGARLVTRIFAATKDELIDAIGEFVGRLE